MIFHEKRIECYLEEYKNSEGQLCARIKDRETDKTVVLSGDVNKQHFLRFLSAARICQDKIPTIWDKNGTDIVVVYGYIEAETDNEITVCVNTPNGGYAFGIKPSTKPG